MNEQTIGQFIIDSPHPLPPPHLRIHVQRANDCPVPGFQQILVCTCALGLVNEGLSLSLIVST